LSARATSIVACLAIAACSHPDAPANEPASVSTSTGPAGTRSASAAALPLHFTDVTKESGVDMVITSGRSPSTQILEVKGGGIALIDYNNDGRLDIFVPNGAYLDAPDRGPGCRLYENLGGMRFKDVTREAELDFHGWGMGVAVGDVDGDGYDDIYIACYGPDVLLKNTGHGTFVDATKESGLGDPRWSTGCAFADLDGDGDLDLALLATQAGGDSAAFVIPCLHAKSGEWRALERMPTGLRAYAIAAGDLDGDGRAKILVSAQNSHHVNLWTRSGDGFARCPDIGVGTGPLGLALVDLDRDGRPELVVASAFSNQLDVVRLR
jgi:hypothetical protein